MNPFWHAIYDEKVEKKEKKKGPARDRTGIVGIRIQSDNHYTTEPIVGLRRELLKI